MQVIWPPTKSSNQLVLFFNGFAMDHHPLAHIDTAGFDIAFVQAYRTLSWTTMDVARMEHYDTIHVVAWSLGVWVYSQLAIGLPLRRGCRIAINGTLYPIDRRRGIAPVIFDLTLKNFDARGRESFYERVCGNAEMYERFRSIQPQRTWQDQHAELAFLQASILGQNPETPVIAVPPFECAIIGAQDKIFSPLAQKTAWENIAPTVGVESGHFPFYLWDSWEELLSLGASL